MSTMIFVNLPVADVERSTAFYTALGWPQQKQFSNESASMIVVSDTIAFMLISHERFRQFIDRPLADPRHHVQALFCLSAATRAAVHDLVEAAEREGGKPDPCPIQDHGFMYGRSFEDPDGHVVEVMWMDPAMLPADPSRE